MNYQSVGEGIAFTPPTLAGRELSEQELFVFDRLIEGRSIPKIAEAMNVRNAVVMDLRWEILQKCGCKNLVELTIKLLHLERDKANRLSVAIVGEVA